MNIRMHYVSTWHCKNGAKFWLKLGTKLVQGGTIPQEILFSCGERYVKQGRPGKKGILYQRVSS